jgi:hypothetical protein
MIITSKTKYNIYSTKEESEHRSILVKSPCVDLTPSAGTMDTSCVPLNENQGYSYASTLVSNTGESFHCEAREKEVRRLFGSNKIIRVQPICTDVLLVNFLVTPISKPNILLFFVDLLWKVLNYIRLIHHMNL